MNTATQKTPSQQLSPQQISPEQISPQQKSETLIEALPWLETFADKVVVIKFGGNAMVNKELEKAFAEDIRFFPYAGLKPVVVHGGGPRINSMLERLQIDSEFKGGLRVTTPETMDVVRMEIGRASCRERV